MQISEHPASEAIFATMALQMKADSTDVGFSTILGLINDLIDDAKDQLQQNTLTWKKTDARCKISAMSFKDKQAYFSSRATVIQNQQNRNGEMEAMMKGNQDYLKRLITFLTNFKKNHSELETALEKGGKDSKTSVEQAITETNAAIESVKQWNTSNTSFVQEKLEKVALSYLQVHSYKLVIPATLLQTGAGNAVVQKRLVEWLNKLKISFQTKLGMVEDSSAARVGEAKDIKEKSGKSIKVAEKLLFSTENGLKSYAEAVKQLGHSHELLTGLAAENADLIKSNDDYCKIEKKNFNGSKSNLTEQIEVFKKVRDYFGTNYAKLSNFVKNKYQ
jgi:hypothetical protein